MNFLVTYYTSAVTLSVLGNVKVVLSIFISVLVFQNELTGMGVLGCAITLAGVYMYQQVGGGGGG
jgi:drug/metabolite transporter (DMT)-like permease